VKIGGEWFTVVGVAGNSKYSDLDEAPQPFVFWAALQRYQHYMVLHVRVAGDPKRYAAPVAAAIHSLNAGILVLDQFPLTRNVEFASTGARVAGAFVGMLGMVGVTLAAIGIYGVIAYTTRQRRHEIGIRMAVGARRRHVFGLIVQQGLRLAAIGIAGGVLCSLVCVPFLRSQLYGVTPNNLPIYLGVAVIMSLVALGASFLPALLAALVDPIRALRYK
jgi:ABC-type antimicrobial peptide transport system permease subunit